MKKNNFIFSQFYRTFSRIARKVREEDFCAAESYAARDALCRYLAAEAYGLAKKFAEEEEEKISLQYMKLAAKLLGLSLRPKKLCDLDEIKRALEKLKAEKASS